MEKLIINRSKWLRGESSARSSLYRPSDDKSCCVGLYGLSLGFSKEDLAYGHVAKTCQSKSVPPRAEWPRWLLTDDDLTGKLYHTNDVINMTASEREQKIKSLFAINDVQVDFID